MTEIRTQFVGEDDNIQDNQLTCFICAEYLTSRNDQEDKCYDREYSIRTIFRHLKISEIIETTKTYKQPVDLVPFCEPCFQIFKTLSSYYTDLEVLQMRINYLLNKLNELTIVKETKQEYGPTDKARKQLKIKLEEKCTSNNQTGPLVVLPQLEVAQIRAITYQNPNSNSVNLSDDEYERAEDNGVLSDRQCHSSDDVDYDSDTDRPPKNKQRKSKRTHHPLSSKDGGIFPWVKCNCVFKQTNSLLEHSTLFHPEKHFPSKSKPNNLTTPQHKIYLTHLLNTEVNSCGSWTSGFICIYCAFPFKTKRKHAVRLHLINIHQDKLLENLTKLQQKMSPEEISKKVKIPVLLIPKEKVLQERETKLRQFCKAKNRMKPEHTCPTCQVRTTSLRKHEALHHPEKFLLSKRFEHVTSEQFKLYCVYLINKLVEKFTKSQVDGKVRFNCSHCQSSYIDLQGCRNHMVLGHESLLLVEIEKLQRNMKPEELKIIKSLKRSKPKYYIQSIKKVVEINTIKCEICDVCLTQRGLAIHMKKNHPSEYVKRYNCEVCLICKKNFSSKWWLDYHRVNAHANEIFEKWKVAKITEEQFKIYCDYLIDSEIRGLGSVAGTSDGKIRRKCGYCASSFDKLHYAQIHLVMKHKEILGGKLEELQKGKTVREIENDMVFKREESGERFGGEVDNDFEETEVFCGKSVVKEEGSEIRDEMGGDLEDLNEIGLEKMDMEIKEEDKMDDEAILPD